MTLGVSPLFVAKKSPLTVALTVALALTPISSILRPTSVLADEVGKALYEKHCSQCHGDKGDGLGPAAAHFNPLPRDFTKGKYKFRTTPSGSLPTDADIERAIHDGLAFTQYGAYTVMPPWPKFTAEEMKGLVAHLKSFSPKFSEGAAPPPIAIGEPPASTEESIKKGREIFEKNECIKCHGMYGRSDGRSAPTLKDDWGNGIRPADLTKKWTFRGGGTKRDIFKTVTTGLNGTPMPAYVDSTSEEDRWHLVNYIVSLSNRETPEYNKADRPIVAVPLQGTLDITDISKARELFANSKPAFLPVVGQVIEPGRSFHPGVNELEIRALYNADEIALMLTWHDMTGDLAGSNGLDLAVPTEEDHPQNPVAVVEEEGGDPFASEESSEADPFAEEEGSGDTGGTAKWSDAVAVQLPVKTPEGFKLPYFLFGDSALAAEIWFQDLSLKDGTARREAVAYTGKGSGSLAATSAVKVDSVSAFEHGQWTVILKRKRTLEGTMPLNEASFVPIAFSVWDGFNNERGMKRGVTSWFQLYLEPSQKESPLKPMLIYGLGLFAAEIVLIAFVRRRKARGVARK